MKKIKSWYLPDNEEHFVKEMTQKNVDGYQIPSRQATLKKIKNHSVNLQTFCILIIVFKLNYSDII